jgi:hypothetical protein
MRKRAAFLALCGLTACENVLGLNGGPAGGSPDAACASPADATADTLASSATVEREGGPAGPLGSGDVMNDGAADVMSDTANDVVSDTANDVANDADVDPFGTPGKASAAISPTTGDLNVAAVGPDHSLMYYGGPEGAYFAGRPSSYPVAEAGTTFSQPAISVSDAGDVDIAALGPNGTVLHYHAGPDLSWSSDTVLAAPLPPDGDVAVSRPAIFVRPSGEVDVVIETSSNNLALCATTPGNPWLCQTFGYGKAFSSPALFERPSGEVDVVVLNSDGTLAYYWGQPSYATLAEGSTPFDGQDIGNPGTFYSAPAIFVDSDANATAHVVAMGASHTAVLCEAKPGLQWAQYSVGPPGTLYSAPALVVRPASSHEVDIVGVGANNSLVYIFGQAPTGFWPPATLPGSGFSTPSIAVDPNGMANVLVLGASDTIQYDWATPGFGWQDVAF